MIRNIEPSSREMSELFGHPCMAAAIGSRAACPQPGSDFWVLERDGKTLAFLCRIGGGAYITGSPDCIEELEEFAPFMGYRQLLTDLPLKAEGETTELMAMEQTAPLPWAELPRLEYSNRPGGFSAADFGKLQAECGAITKEEVAGYTVELSLTLRANAAAAILLRDHNGKASAGAALGHSWGGFGLIEGVAVLPRYRWQGLGALMAANIACLAVEQGLRPVLYTRPELKRLYQKAGFTPIEPLFITERNL